MTPGKYILSLRTHIESRFGTDLKSTVLKKATIFCPEHNKKIQVDVVRFMQHFPYKKTTKPYIDVFVDPHLNKVKMHLFDDVLKVRIIEPDVRINELEIYFALLIFGVEQNGDGVFLPPKIIQVH